MSPSMCLRKDTACWNLLPYSSEQNKLFSASHGRPVISSQQGIPRNCDEVRQDLTLFPETNYHIKQHTTGPCRAPGALKKPSSGVCVVSPL